MTGLRDVTGAQWAALARRPVFFGHQSVGHNIMSGVTRLLAGEAIPLTVVESREPRADQPAFYHAAVGRNEYPLEKFDDFAAIAARFAQRPAIVMVKLCYVDIHRHTDAAALFADYRRRIDALRAAHPGLTVVHVTTPLTRTENWKGRLMATLRGHVPASQRNLARQRYNERLRQAYQGREPLFDLALLESTRPDGSRATIQREGQDVPFLVPEYTDDGGHLNPLGQRRAAEQLLALLARST